MKTYFNTTHGPVTIDDEGKTVGGGEWAALDSTKQVRSALKSGWLVEVDEPEEVKRTSPAAQAFKEVDKAKAEKEEKKN